MVKRTIIYIFGLVALSGCNNGVELEIQDVGDQPGAFIECYCQVGELYNLTATYLSPIDEAQHLDYSHNFTAHITDTTRHKLSRGLFHIGNYIYSHGSPKRLPNDFEGELKLEILTPKGEVFTVFSSVPDPVQIESAEHVGESVIVHFETSQEAEQNYFAISIVMKDSIGRVVRSRVRLINPQSSKRESVTLYYDDDEDDEEFQTIDVALKRFNKEGYIYQYSILENKESVNSNIVAGVPLRGNIVGANGIFTCYTKSQIQLVNR